MLTMCYNPFRNINNAVDVKTGMKLEYCHVFCGMTRQNWLGLRGVQTAAKPPDSTHMYCVAHRKYFRFYLSYIVYLLTQFL